MTPTDSFTLFLACAAAMASPGPGIAAVTARAAAFGMAGAAAFITGMIAGDLVLFTAAALGLSAAAAFLEPWRPALTAAAGLWLIILAWGQARDSAAPPPAQARRDGAAAGFLLTIANPKTILFYMALLPAVFGMAGLSAADIAAAGAIVAATLAAIMSAYAWAAAGAAKLMRNPRPLRLIAAGIMGLLGAALLVESAAALF